MPLSPDQVLAKNPGLTPEQAQQLAAQTGYQVPIAPQVPQAITPSITMPQDLAQPQILPPVQPQQEEPPSAQAQSAPIVLGSDSRQMGSTSTVTPSAVSPETRREAGAFLQADIVGRHEALAHQEAAANIRGPAQEAAANARADIEGQADASSMAQQELARREVEDKHADLQKSVRDVETSEVNPNRLWESKSAPAKVTATLGVALGAFGASLTHTQNTAYQMLHDQIEADTRAQEANLAKKQWQAGLAKDSLSQAVQKYGSVQAGVAAVKAQKLQYVDTQLARAEAMAKTEDQKAALANTRAQIADDAKAQLIAFDTAVNEKRSVSSSSSRTVAQQEHAAPAPNVPAGQTTQGQVQDLSQRLEKAAIPESKQQIQHALKNWKLEDRDPTKPIAGLGYNYDALDKLPGGRRLMSTEARENRKNLEQIFLGYRHELTGAGGSDSEMDQMKQAFYGARTPQELRDTMKSYDEKLAAKEQNIRAGYSPEANALYNQRNPGIFAPAVKK